MLEPSNNPNSRLMIDPPFWLRYVLRNAINRIIAPGQIAARRKKAEAARRRKGEPHRVLYFHQLGDPYSHLAAQTLARLAENYEIVLEPYLVRATGGPNQPEEDKLARWARRDAELIAPFYGLSFPQNAPLCPNESDIAAAAEILAGLDARAFAETLPAVSAALWEGRALDQPASATPEEASAALTAGSKKLAALGHYSGAMFYYAGEWYWGADRLFYLEQRLRALNAARHAHQPFICARPAIDVKGIDASDLSLDFYPSLNSPYTSIIYDQTIAMARECGIGLNHKPVLPMIMRGVPASREKGTYIMFDTKREGDFLGVPFGPVMTPIGEPVRRLYSLLPWAAREDKEIELLSAALRLAFTKGVPLHKTDGMRRAVEAAGLNWEEAQTHLGSEEWKRIVTQNQQDMVEGLGLWGVPSYRLSGGGVPDLAVWGQDRLWLIAAEIRRRAGNIGMGRK